MKDKAADVVIIVCMSPALLLFASSYRLWLATSLAMAGYREFECD